MNRVVFLLLAVILVSSCGIWQPLPDYGKQRNCYAIEVAAGPEDFVLDQWHTKPRLLISSHERRGPERYGGIYSYDIATGYSENMPRKGEPESLQTFQPHGMDIRHADGKTFLYVILHDLYNHSVRDENGIAVYLVSGDTLLFQELMIDPVHLWSPNDLSVLENGEIYASNDFRSMFDVYFRKKTSEVVHYSIQEKKWSVVASDLSFANGVLALPDRVYVAATRSDKLLAYPRKSDGTLGTGEEIVEIKGLDNIMPCGKRLLIAAHFDDLAFFRHHKDPGIPAPSVVFLIDPVNPSLDQAETVVYADDGRQISAASTAFAYQNKLYISQVFGTRILVCDAEDLAGFDEPGKGP